MNTFFLYYTVVLTVIIFLPLYRVVEGPTIFDRMLGVGAIGTKTMVLILAIGLIFNRLDMFV
ncbi:MAG TPA: pH regulation protein F, partial [Nitrospiria bacterium]|nr:pH regulation protein F [Nitrospiria bacterium]